MVVTHSDTREADASTSSSSSDVGMQQQQQQQLPPPPQQRAQCEAQLPLLPSVLAPSVSAPAAHVTAAEAVTPRARSDSSSAATFAPPLLSASPPPLVASASAPSASFASTSSFSLSSCSSSSDVPASPSLLVSSPSLAPSSLSSCSSSASSPAAAVSSLSVPSSPLVSSPLVSPASATRRPKLVDGLLHSSCHQCKTTKAQHLVFSCRSRPSPQRRSRQCRKKYCSTCLLRTYGLDLAALTAEELKVWVCPACVDSCCCAACKRSKEKSYAEHLKATHPAAVISAGGVLQQGETSTAAGLPSLSLPGGAEQQDLTSSAVSTPSQSALMQQIQQLQQIQQMQQLHQTLQLLQTLANQNEATGRGGGGAQQQPSFPSSPSLQSSAQTQQTPAVLASSPISPAASQLSILQSPPQIQRETDDTTFGHQLDLRIALLRQQQQRDRDGAESSVRLPAQTPLKAVTSSGSSSSRAASHIAPASSSPPMTPSACSAETVADGSNYAAIANKLMAAAALATRIFQEQQSGQEAQHYQQQCRLQQQLHAQQQQQQQQQHQNQHQQQHEHQQQQNQQQQQQTFGPVLNESASLRSSLSSPSHQLSSTMPPSLPMLPLSSADAEWSQSLQQHGEVHRMQMLALQEHQRVQLQQLLQQQAIVRHHAVHNANHGGAVPLTPLPPPSINDAPPLKRQALSAQSDSSSGSGSLQQLQQQVEALQVESLRLEQRRLQQQEDDIVMQQQQQQLLATDSQRRQRQQHQHHHSRNHSHSRCLPRSPRSSLKSEPDAVPNLSGVKVDADGARVPSACDTADGCERRMSEESPLHFLTDSWQSGDAYVREASSDAQQLQCQPMRQGSADDDSDWQR